MADNVPITPGAGATIATDDVGGAQFQRFKLDVGADGASVPVVGALPVSATALPLPTGAATATGQAAIVAAIGAIPAGPGTVAVSNFPATQPVSAAALPLPAGAATEATLAAINTKTPAVGQVASAASSPVVLASDQSIIPVNTLGQPGVARKITANGSAGASTNQALTASTRRISIVALGSALRYVIGTGAQTASATSHYIQLGERLDLATPASAQIAVLSDTTTAGSLELTELL